MIQVITERKQIAKLQNQFREELLKNFDEEINCWLGHPGGNFQWQVFYSNSENIWVAFIDHENRSWNGFGIGRPRENKNNSIIGEINFPIEGINRRIASAFALDSKGKVVILHRGRIGGGSPGVGKSLFIDNFKGEIITAIEGNKEITFCYVAELSSSLFVKQIATYIKEIDAIKRLKKYGSTYDFSNFHDYVYTNEKFGTSVTERNDPKIVSRTHGIIVNALEKEIKLLGFETGNDRNRDLFAHKKGKITSLFEIKTSISTQSLYSAVGQLLIYSIPILTKHKLIAVFPQKLNISVEKHLQKFGIHILYFDFNNGNPLFLNLKQLLEYGSR